MSSEPPPPSDPDDDSPGRRKPPAPPKASAPAPSAPTPPGEVVPIAPPSLRKKYGTQALLDARPGQVFPEHLSLSPKPTEKASPRRKRDRQRAVTLAPEDVKTLLDIASSAPPSRKNVPVTLAAEDFEEIVGDENPSTASQGAAKSVLGGLLSTPSVRRALLAVPVLVSLGIVVVFSLGERRPRGEGTPHGSPAVTTVPPRTDREAELQAAAAKGEAALAELAAKYPNDADVLTRYARTLTENGKHADAVARAAQALEADPSAAENKQLATVLWMGAQSKAEVAAFELLQKKMGARGADIAYDLATTDGVRAATRVRARAYLASQRFAREASAQTFVAAELVVASKCEVRKALLTRAANVGDRRTLELLERFDKGELCVEGEKAPCNACLTDGGELARTISKLRQRLDPTE